MAVLPTNFLAAFGMGRPKVQLPSSQAAKMAKMVHDDLLSDPTVPDSLANLAGAMADDLAGYDPGATPYGEYGERNSEGRTPWHDFSIDGSFQIISGASAGLIASMTGGATPVFTADEDTRTIISNADADKGKDIFKEHAIRAVIAYANITAIDANVQVDSEALSAFLAHKLSLTGEVNTKSDGTFLYNVPFKALLGGYVLRPDEYANSFCRVTDSWKVRFDYPGEGHLDNETLSDLTIATQTEFNAHVSIGLLAAIDTAEQYKQRCAAFGVKARI